MNECCPKPDFYICASTAINCWAAAAWIYSKFLSGFQPIYNGDCARLVGAAPGRVLICKNYCSAI